MYSNAPRLLESRQYPICSTKEIEKPDELRTPQGHQGPQALPRRRHHGQAGVADHRLSRAHQVKRTSPFTCIFFSPEVASSWFSLLTAGSGKSEASSGGTPNT